MEDDALNEIQYDGLSEDEDVLLKDSAVKKTFKSSGNYGWFCFKPPYVQRFNTARYFLLTFAYFGFVQGFTCTGLNNAFFTTIEERFGFSAKQTALLNTSYHISNGLFVSILCYFGHRHRPRTMGIGILVLSIGLFMTTIPHFSIGQYIGNASRDTITCDKSANQNITSIDCTIEENKPSSKLHLLLFILAYFIMGIGNAPVYGLGVSHIDEITNRGQNMIYTSIFFVFAALGPAIGYMVAKLFLSIYVDISVPDGIQLTPEDNNWIGAWWLGFVIGAILLLLPVIPMLGFPRLFPNAEILKENKKSFEDTVEEDHNLKHDFKSIWPATKALLKNKPFMLICLASASESLGVGGFSTFFPKLVQTQFHFTASNASFSTGLIVIPGVAGGIFLGGYIIKKLQWTCRKTLRGSALFAFISTLLVAVVLLGCDGRDVTGANVAYPNSEPSNISLINTCNSGCSCSTKYYKPVCSMEDGRTYFSACHAGCTTQSDKIFKNCTCLAPGTSNVEEGRCTPSCKFFPVFAIGAFLLFFFTFLNNVPMVNATFRVVPEGQGSFAMGFQQIFIRFLGFIPAPTLFGSFVDKSCKLWQIDECTGDTTSCLEYENKDFRLYIFALGVITKFLSFVFIFMAFKLYKLPSSKFRMSNLQNRPNTADKIEDELARIEDETLNTGA